VVVKKWKAVFDEAIELVQAQLESRHLGKVVRAKVIRVHESDQHAERFLVRHLDVSRASV
jgi:hypothetical protein